MLSACEDYQINLGEKFVFQRYNKENYFGLCFLTVHTDVFFIFYTKLE